MRVYVICLTSKTISLDIDPCQSIETIFTKVQETEGVLSGQTRLIFNGRQLERTGIISESNIQQYSTLHLVLCLNGGRIKKTQYDPVFIALTDKYFNKKICQKCYATNHSKADVCRKRKCGHSSALRFKRTLYESRN